MTKSLTKTILAATLAIAGIGSAFASTSQTTAPVDYSSYGGWNNDLLSEINLPAHTI